MSKVYVRPCYYDVIDFLRLKGKKEVDDRFIEKNFSYFNEYYRCYQSSYFTANVNSKKEIKRVYKLLKNNNYVLDHFVDDYDYNIFVLNQRIETEFFVGWDFPKGIVFFVPKKNKLFLKIFNQLIYKEVYYGNN